MTPHCVLDIFSTRPTKAPFHYQIKGLIIRSREVSKPQYLYFKLSDRFEIQITNLVAWRLHKILR